MLGGLTRGLPRASGPASTSSISCPKVWNLCPASSPHAHVAITDCRARITTGVGPPRLSWRIRCRMLAICHARPCHNPQAVGDVCMHCGMVAVHIQPKSACFSGCKEPQMMRSAGPQSSRTSHISRHGIDRLTASSSSGSAADSAASAPLPLSDASVACKHRHADGWSVDSCSNVVIHKCALPAAGHHLEA